MPTGHSGALTSIHRFRVPTGLSGDTHLDFHDEMDAIYCFRVPAEGARKNRGSQCLLEQKPIFAHRKPETKTREPGCQNVWTSRKTIRATLIEGPRNVWSASKKSRCSFR